MPDASDFFRRYHLSVYRYFLRVVGDVEEAEDLTQEVFLRIVRGLGRYTADGREEAWVFTIARAVQAEHGRTARQVPPLIPLDEGVHGARDPRQVVALGVREALDLVPRPERALLVLRELGGLSYEELAALCGVEVGAVRMRMSRARELVRWLLPGRARGRGQTESDQEEL